MYVVTDENTTIPHQHIRTEPISDDMIKNEVPDYRNRVFYISSTQAMVKAMQEILSNFGVFCF